MKSRKWRKVITMVCAAYTAVLSTLLPGCNEEQMHHAYIIEVELTSLIDSGYVFVYNHLDTQRVDLTINNEIATAAIEVDTDCADVEVFLFRQMSEPEWINEVSSVEITYMNNLSTTGVHHIKNAQQEPDKWTEEHWFKNNALGGIEQRIVMSSCYQKVDLEFLSMTPEQPYIFFQHCVYDNEVLIDCTYVECLECPFQEGKVSIPIYGVGSWCANRALVHELGTYIFYNDTEVFIGYY